MILGDFRTCVTLVLGGVTGLNNNESLYSCWWCIWFIIQSKLGITPQQAIHIVGIFLADFQHRVSLPNHIAFTF